MKIQEKVYIVVDANGNPLATRKTRESARKAKKMYQNFAIFGHVLPLQIVQYKRWKKVR